MIFSPEEFSSQNHKCTLNTILSIEYFIQENSGAYSKTELWDSLPKKIMYQSYKVVLEYLLFSKKIEIKGKKVVWIGSSYKFSLEDFNSINHSCTLTTISSIYEFIQQNPGVYSKTELWNSLPKKIMYQSYKVVLEYLIYSGLISVENRKVCGGGGK